MVLLTIIRAGYSFLQALVHLILTGVLPAPRTLPACALGMALFLALKASSSLEAFFKRLDVEKLSVNNYSTLDNPLLYFLR